MRTKRQNKPKRYAATKKGGKGKRYSTAKRLSKKAKSINMRQRRRTVTRRKMRGGVDEEESLKEYQRLRNRFREAQSNLYDDDLLDKSDENYKLLRQKEKQALDEFNDYRETPEGQNASILLDKREIEKNREEGERVIDKHIEELNKISDYGKNYTSDNFFDTRYKLNIVPHPVILRKFEESDEGKKYLAEKKRREEHENASTIIKSRNNKKTPQEYRNYDKDEINYLRKKFASLLRSGREDKESDLYKFVQVYGRKLLGYYVKEFPGTLKKYGFYYYNTKVNSLYDISKLINEPHYNSYLYDQYDVIMQTLKFFNDKHPLPATAATPSQTA